MQSERRPIVVVGSLNMDMVSRVHAIPRAGETIFGINFQTHPGGKGANQAVGVARLGYPVTMIGMLGKDAFGKELREHLGREGVDTGGIAEVNIATGTASILVDDAGQNCIVVTSGANSTLTPATLRSHSDVLRTAGIVLAQLEIPIETIGVLSEMCREFGVPLILDPAPAAKLPATVLEGVTWFTPNETEADFYADSVQAEDYLVNKLFDMGLHGLILKQGAKGCLLVGEDRSVHRISAPIVQSVDSTAAGDAFNAAFAVALLGGRDPAESAKFACTAAAISVTRAGAQPSLASAAEVNAALQLA